PVPEFADRMFGEEFRPRPLVCRLPGDCLRSVLAELERRGVLGIGPGAARTVEPIGLVLVEQRLGALDHDLLPAQRHGHRTQRVPAASGMVVFANAGNRLALGHGALLLSCCFVHMATTAADAKTARTDRSFVPSIGPADSG